MLEETLLLTFVTSEAVRFWDVVVYRYCVNIESNYTMFTKSLHISKLSLSVGKKRKQKI